MLRKRATPSPWPNSRPRPDRSRNLFSNLRKTARTSSSSNSIMTNLMRRLKCTRDSLRSRKVSPTPTSCVSRSSRGNWNVLRTELKRLSQPSTSSDPERESLQLLLPDQRNPPTSRKPKLLSRRPSTKSTLEAPPPLPSHQAPPWTLPPPFRLPETSVPPQPSAELVPLALPELAP